MRHHCPLGRAITSLVESRSFRSTPLVSNVPSRPKRLSPYRLIAPVALIETFGPLRAAGWRLASLPTSSPDQPNATERWSSVDDLADVHDLQDKRLVRAYGFEGKDGWRELMHLVQLIGEQAEVEDHHPTITVSPAVDYGPSERALAQVVETSRKAGYILELSTHTHTPLPPIGQPKDGIKMRPGVTGKDVTLAEKVEQLHRSLKQGRPE